MKSWSEKIDKLKSNYEPIESMIHKFKDYFHCKAKMLSAEEVLSATGHAVGGVCPFALPDPKPSVYLDVSLQRFETVFPACGSSNSAIELAPDELFRYAGAAAWIDICRPFERA